jgi:transposase
MALCFDAFALIFVLSSATPLSHRVARRPRAQMAAADRAADAEPHGAPAWYARVLPRVSAASMDRRVAIWAPQLQPFGHTVRLLPADDVARYVRRNKTDRTDAKALLEASRNAEIHAVPVKTIAVQAVASLHRLRSAWVATRTARLNTVRGLLRESGLFIPVGAAKVVPHVRTLLADPTSQVPDSLRPLLERACDEIGTPETDIHAVERQLTSVAREMAAVPVLQTIRGIGVLTATALVALVGDIHRFPSAGTSPPARSTLTAARRTLIRQVRLLQPRPASLPFVLR